MTIYIDKEYKCHVTNDGTMTAIETDYFVGKCNTYIEGYMFIPSGHSFTRADGCVLRGEMIAPWKPYSELDSAQREYERQLLAEYKALIDELYSEVTN